MILKLKKLLTKILVKLKEHEDDIATLNSNIQIRTITWEYTVLANSNANTSLKNLIDSDLPSGCRYLGLAGFSTNNVNVHFISIRYAESNYGLQIRNIGSSSISGTVQIIYMYSK